MDIINNKILIGNISAQGLVEKYGSPLYVYDINVIRRSFSELREHIKYPSLQIFYTCKANSNIALMQVLRKQGANITTVSSGEVYSALKAGFSSFNIFFCGTNITDDELFYCIDKNIRISIGSLSLLRRYGERYRGTDVTIRLNINLNDNKNEEPSNYDSKFGIDINDLEEVKKIVSEYRLTITGFHSHFGSGFMDTAHFIDGMTILLANAENFPEVDFINIGGGLGIPYKPEEESIELVNLGDNITKKMQSFSDIMQRTVTLAIEPGRFLVAESGSLLTRVNTIKQSKNYTIVGVDTGFNHLQRPFVYNSYHGIHNASNPTAEPADYVIAGNICEEGDLFTRENGTISTRSIPTVEEGDVILIDNTGAYGFSMSSNYNSRTRPAEILVENEKERVIRKRETFEGLIHNQVY